MAPAAGLAGGRLPSVRDVPLRSRPDGSAAATRIAALMPVREGGWVPPPESVAPLGDVLAVDGPAANVERPAEGDDLSADEPDGRSWTSRAAPGAHLAATTRRNRSL